MAVTVHVARATKICVAIPGVDLSGTSTKTNAGGTTEGALYDLGWSRNGVQVSYEDFHLDVPGDQHGGDDGPPIDVQWLGSIARIRAELTKFDHAVFEAVAARVSDSTWGEVDIFRTSATEKTPGDLMFTGVRAMRVFLSNGVQNRNFPRCIVRAAIDYNYATKYTSPIIEWEAHHDGESTSQQIVHNTTSSG